MIKIVILVFVGGAVGAMLREFLMLMVPTLSRGFPLDILAANLVAAFLLGLMAGLHSRKVASDKSYALIGTGMTGGLSTFSSFAYGSSVLMTHSAAGAVVASAYIAISLVMGYIVVRVGMKIGEQHSGYDPNVRPIADTRREDNP
jgi:fluoride exporter